jgi:hypothetical protein
MGPPIADYIKPLTEWFKNPSEALRLPSIPARIANALGTPEKPVILKPNILQKNLAAHPDLTPEMSAQILQETINRPTQIIQGKPTNKANYWVFIKKHSPNKISILEVSEAKKEFKSSAGGWETTKQLLESKKTSGRRAVKSS